MPLCSRCPGRVFKDDNALQMHMRSGSHRAASSTTYDCGTCNKVFCNQTALEQHTRDKHSFFECNYCDREFATEQGRAAHEEAKHPPTFECHYCDREFNSEESREQHEEAKHPSTFECRYCDREFNSEGAREQHEEAKHPTFECHYCSSAFFSENARQQHENAQHHFECKPCGKSFTQLEALQQHQQSKPHFICNYCTAKFFTWDSKGTHEKSCSCNPANTVARSPIPPSWSEGLSRPKAAKLTGSGDKGSPTLAVTTGTNEGPKPPAPPSHSSDPSLDGGETLHSTSGTPSTEAPSKETIVEGPCLCTHSLEPCTCSICRRTSSLSLDTDPPVPDGAESIIPVDHKRQDDAKDVRSISSPCISSLNPCNSAICRRRPSLSSEPDEPTPDNAGDIISSGDQRDDATDVQSGIFYCAPCVKVFETQGAFQNHVCALPGVILRPHCPVCYTQFDNGLLLQEHIEGVQFSCELCLTRCCSEEMLQDHLLSHPTCGKCSRPFADDLALCAHVESDHLVVVCWDCEGIVVETDSLESHYTESSAHPSCAICGVGKRTSVDMEEHTRHAHAPSAEMEGGREGGDMHVSPDGDSSGTKEQPLEADGAEATQSPLAASDSTQSPPVVEVADLFSGPDDKLHASPLQTDSSLYLTPQSVMPSQAGQVNEAVVNSHVINGEEPPEVDSHQYTSPSPTPSEHGSDTTRPHLPDSETTNAVINHDARALSPASSVSAELFSDTSTQSSSLSSGHSVVFVSADGIPDYIRENRAILVATSTGSPSSGRTPLRLSSSSSLESLEIVEPAPIPSPASTPIKDHPPAPLGDACANPNQTTVSTGTGARVSTAHPLHCRICLLNPCEDMTVTICGHLFCKRCITQAVVAKSECPVCKSITLLYCLFRLDLSV